METTLKRPLLTEVKVEDTFWTSYLKNIRTVMLPYVFRKFEETGYIKNFREVGQKTGEAHVGPPFSDGLVLESMRGVFDFLAVEKDEELENYFDQLIEVIAAAADVDPDGYLCTQTTQDYPEKRWGENGGDIVIQHDLYDHGALIEAGISHYLATGKTTLLRLAVRAANLICSLIGEAPKKNIVPGHSLPEEAFVKLYRLFRDRKELQDFAREHQVNQEEYLRIAEFWYDARGNHEGRNMSKQFAPEYNQDHVIFAKQDKAVGHAVRAMLCYLGAAAVAREKNREDYVSTLKILWENVVERKLHISGGIGTRHDIEGFDVDYNLPNNAYLETCAAIGFAFWNGEMHLIDPDAKYFDYFERAMYNNILASIGQDFGHYFYQNPLESDGSLHRWDWHICPCCPPMLLKFYSNLGSYIYSYSEEKACVNVNLWIGSQVKTEFFEIEQKDHTLKIDSKGKELTVRIRIPEYVENFAVLCGGEERSYDREAGYAVLKGIWSKENALKLSFSMPVRRIAANPNVEADRGKVAVMYGPYLMCAEGIDNDGNVNLRIAKNPQLQLVGDQVYGRQADGKEFCLIPYYRWCNRGDQPTDAKMAVWFDQEGMCSNEELGERMQEKLYAVYETIG